MTIIIFFVGMVFGSFFTALIGIPSVREWVFKHINPPKTVQPKKKTTRRIVKNTKPEK